MHPFRQSRPDNHTKKTFSDQHCDFRAHRSGETRDLRCRTGPIHASATPHSRPKPRDAPLPGPVKKNQAPCFRVLGSGSRGFWLGSGFWGPRVLLGFWVLGSGFSAPGSLVLVLGSGFWVLVLGSRSAAALVLGSAFCVLRSAFWVLGSE